MKVLRWLPLAFVADFQGFAFFASYVAAVLLVREVVRHGARLVLPA